MEVLTGWWDDFFWGSLVVVELFFVALILTVLFGLIGSAAKLSKNRFANAIANGYTIVFRGTPEILVLLLFYFGSAIALTGGMMRRGLAETWIAAGVVLVVLYPICLWFRALKRKHPKSILQYI